VGLRGKFPEEKLLQKAFKDSFLREKKAHGGVVVGGFGDSSHNKHDVGQIICFFCTFNSLPKKMSLKSRQQLEN
jgi:hypothetical protein